MKKQKCKMKTHHCLLADIYCEKSQYIKHVTASLNLTFKLNTQFNISVSLGTIVVYYVHLLASRYKTWWYRNFSWEDRTHNVFETKKPLKTQKSYWETDLVTTSPGLDTTTYNVFQNSFLGTASKLYTLTKHFQY